MATLQPIQGKKIYVYDEGGYLPDNPDEWPEELKRDIRRCCCGGASSPGPQPTRNNPCCPGLKLPDTLRANLRNTRSHDTGVELRYFPQVVLPLGQTPPGIGVEAFTVPTSIFSGQVIYPQAWYSDLIFDYSCSYEFSGTYFDTSFGFPNQVNWVAQYDINVFYYLVFGWTIPIGFTVPASCGVTIAQVTYPEGQITFSGPFNPGMTRPITWINNQGLPGEINAFNAWSFNIARKAVTGGRYAFADNTNNPCGGVKNCNTFDVKMPLSRTAFDYTNEANTFVTGCRRMKIGTIWTPPGTPPGQYPIFVRDEEYETEPGAECIPNLYDTQPHVELFI